MVPTKPGADGNQANTSRDDAPKVSSQRNSHVLVEELDLSKCPAERRASHWRTRRTDYYALASNTNRVRIDCATLFVVSVAAATSATMIALSMAIALRSGPIIVNIRPEAVLNLIEPGEDEVDIGACRAPFNFHGGNGDVME